MVSRRSQDDMTTVVRGSYRTPLLLPHSILFISFLNMYKKYHAILMGVIKQYLVSY